MTRKLHAPTETAVQGYPDGSATVTLPFGDLNAAAEFMKRLGTQRQANVEAGGDSNSDLVQEMNAEIERVLKWTSLLEINYLEAQKRLEDCLGGVADRDSEIVSLRGQLATAQAEAGRLREALTQCAVPVLSIRPREGR